MKNIYLIIITILAAFTAQAQIMINSADLENAGDTFRISVGSPTQIVDFTTTGANTTWNFSNLTYMSQEMDSFFTVASLGSATYSGAFDNPGLPASQSNIVQVSPTFGAIPPLPGISITNIYNLFFKNSSQFRQVGLAATINAVETAMPYNNNDVIYNFPIAYANSDSGNSDASLNIPGTGFYGFTRHRVNNVDGWGMITTPFGTFDALRVRSVINETDTIFYTAVGLGLNIPQPPAVEYKWLAAGTGVPILQINTTITTGIETVSAIRYRDSVRITGINEPENAASFTAGPNPAGENIVAGFELNKPASITLTLYATDGKKIKEIENSRLLTGTHNYLLNRQSLKLSPGIYLLELVIDGNKEYRRLVFTK